jgi:divalent metal cation (Fe/Co/Zn/Cd) transporter
MALALIISGIVVLWYCVKAVQKNPEKPNWTKAFAAAALWPFSLFMKRY